MRAMGGEDSSRPGRVTELLGALRRNEPGARDELLSIVYAELRRLADLQMRGQPESHTLQPTALVHEAYLRLMGGSEVPWGDRAHFLTAAARAMRSILVDFARRRKTLKRGGDRKRVRLDGAAPTGEHAAEEILAVHEALEKLETIDAQGSQIVQLRFFGGLTVAETAEVLGVVESTVYRLWEHARTWLYREIAS